MTNNTVTDEHVSAGIAAVAGDPSLSLLITDDAAREVVVRTILGSRLPHFDPQWGPGSDDLVVGMEALRSAGWMVNDACARNSLTYVVLEAICEKWEPPRLVFEVAGPFDEDAYCETCGYSSDGVAVYAPGENGVYEVRLALGCTGGGRFEGTADECRDWLRGWRHFEWLAPAIEFLKDAAQS